ncbi:transmembrane protein 6/97 [Polychytrium aggregatum]|uniref:transmembrane protein 6/97 n=1 Tax=Polychytrium aggregatum TaxID=110093 RepID=UPI0022FF2869|nr:transmembrane protein 6/97 [Polychytrium aggregatum]KAI9201883.1 transmembrane protein 6/97 [Polychytrium aggregatum]
MTKRPLLSRPLDLTLLVYLLLHLLPCVLINSAIYLPPSPLTAAANGAVDRWLEMSADPFVSAFVRGTGPKWYAAIMASELFMEVPLMLYCIWAIPPDSPSWQIPGVIYATQCVTTVPIILYSLLTEHRDLPYDQTVTIAIANVVFFILPLVMLYRCTLGWSVPSLPSKLKKH